MYSVLLIDDEPSMIESLKRVIDIHPNFQLQNIAYMVSDAKLIIDKGLPDVIITDIKMPGGSGLDLIGYMSENHPEVVMIVVSGYDTFDYVRSAFIFGVEDYLLKPLSPAKFIAFLDRLYIKLNNKKIIAVNKTVSSSKKKPNTLRLSPDEELLEQIEQYITENIAEDNSIDTICKTFYVNHSRISKVFRKYKDCTYIEFLSSLRISIGKQMLLDRQDLLIGTIAELCGFSDQFYFSKVFKNYFGISPSEFRKNHNE